MDQGWMQSAVAPKFAADSRQGVGSTLALRSIVKAMGAIWLINAGFQFSAWVWLPAADDKAGLAHVLAKAVAAAPGWIHPVVAGIAAAIDAISPSAVGLGMVVVALFLGIALITGRGLRAACWGGIAYCFFCWIALCAIGAPYGHGQTDPGVFPAYMIAFVFVLSVSPVVEHRVGMQDDATALSPEVWTAGRLLFGLLWLFDAALKWAPYFQTHFLAQLTPAVQGQPAWIAAYINFVILVVQAIGPHVFAVVIGIVETVIAIGLLSGRWMHLVVPLGFVYSLSVWTTAEGFGGPYSAAGTGVRGNVLGNVLIYAVIFLFLMVPAAQRLREGRARLLAPY